MSISYQAVGWNRQKKIYDGLMVAGIAVYLVVFFIANMIWVPTLTAETLIIRAFGSAAILLLHIILSIGPLCRLDRRFLPLLFNRRHLGVAMFLLALIHGAFSILQFHAFGDINPILSIFTSNTEYDGVAGFPFQPLGLAALVILFLMAATSHDFWLANLSAPVWKALHMLVYLAYALLIGHVVLGVLQAETKPLAAWLLGIGMVWLIAIHLLAAFREGNADIDVKADGYIEVCSVDEIQENRARIVCHEGERIAIFKYEGKVSAISNVCQHQNGPLGEGKIIDGCVTCPWHGYQYKPEDGSSPPPFTEKVPTFNVKLEGKQIWVDPKPNPPGTAVTPALINAEEE